MKLRTDNQRRLYGRDVLKPNAIYDAEKDGNRIVLVEMVPAIPESKPNKVRFEKRGGRTVGVIETDKPFDMAALNQALAEFP